MNVWERVRGGIYIQYVIFELIMQLNIMDTAFFAQSHGNNLQMKHLE